jgi:hypothetical protein
MNLKKMLTPAALAMVLALGTAGAASAQHRESDRTQDTRRNTTRADNSQPQRGRSQQQAVPRQQQAPRQQAPQNFNSAPRSFAAPQQQNRSRGFDNRALENRRPDTRSFNNNTRSFDNRRFDNRGSQNRGFDNRAFQSRGFDNRRFSSPVVRGRFYSPRIIVPRIYRPGFNLGFGLYFGSPRPYRYAYPAYGYGYAVPRVAYGAISFDLNPGNAAVYVDGNYVGEAITFGDESRPLSLTAGTHRIELDADGYEPVAFDVNIVPGQLLPYQGSLQPAY